MDNWERFNETLLPDKESFYSNLNMEDITDVDHSHAKRVFKSLNNKNLGDCHLNNKNLGNYHDLYVQSDTLLLADVFENFRNMCIKVYELDPAHFLPAQVLAWQACLKKTEVELELITDSDMLLIVKKEIRGGIWQVTLRYVKANNKYMKDYNEDNAMMLYGFAVSEPLPVDGFEWMKDLFKIDEDFIKNYDKDSDKGYIIEVDVKSPKKLHDLHSGLPFLPEKMKIDKCKELVCNLYGKKSYVVHIRSLKQALNHGLIIK